MGKTKDHTAGNTGLDRHQPGKDVASEPGMGQKAGRDRPDKSGADRNAGTGRVGGTRGPAASGRAFLPEPRGPVSTALREVLTNQVPAWMVESLIAETAHAARQDQDILFNEDLQLALFIFYELQYRGLAEVADTWEWYPRLLTARAEIEAAFEARLRRGAGSVPGSAPTAGAVADELFRLAGNGNDSSVADRILARASLDQVKEFLVHNSIYQPAEADPHTWALSRLDRDAKTILAELHVDEHGNGQPGHTGAGLLADTLDEVDLESGFGAYIEHMPAITLASINLISFFGLHRRLHGALLGRLAIHEMSSALPSAKYSRGLRRLGFGDKACAYFDEHVEVDATRAQITGRDLADALAQNEPEMREQVLFGAAAACLLDDLLATWQLQAWDGQHSSLRRPLEPTENFSRG